MKLSIIIVSWNVKKKLKNNLEKLFKNECKYNFEVFVVDNNSSDNTTEMVKKNFPQVHLIANEDNLGFAKANNQAIKKSKSDYILLLNPDMQVEKNTIERMIKWMDNNKKATIASCKLITEKGETIKHIRRFPHFIDQLAIVLKIPHIRPQILKNYIRENFDYSHDSEVDSVRGGFFMIRINEFKSKNKFIADVFEMFAKEKNSQITLPYLDERYFIWFEEVDYCRQVKKIGGQIWYTSCTTCTDFIGQSFNQVSTQTKQKYFKDSMLKYFKKWHPHWQFYILQIAWILSSIIIFITQKLNYKSKANT